MHALPFAVAVILAFATALVASTRSQLVPHHLSPPPLPLSATTEALGLVRKLHAFTLPGPRCDLVHLAFVTGACAFTIKWSEQFKVMRDARGWEIA